MFKIKDKAGLDSLSGGSDKHTWQPLRLFNLYRLFLSGLLFTLYEIGPHPAILGEHDPTLYEVASLGYLLFSIGSIFLIRWRSFSFTLQANTQVLTDILALTLLMHASGGLVSGLGLLIVVAIAGGSIMMAGRMANLYAAVGSLAILFEQVYAHLSSSFETTSYTRVGILGTTFFATALLSHVLASRIRESEALAAKRGVDLANMEQVNEHIINSMKTGIVVIDGDDQVRMLNNAARELLQLKGAIPKASLNRLCVPLKQSLDAWRNNQQSATSPFTPAAGASTVLPTFTQLGSDSSAGTLIFLEDYSSLTRHLQQLKLASLGRLTASIAHEIRNPLGAISHAAQLLEESPALDKDDLRLTEIIQDHSQRMNAIVENVLQLSRRETSHPKEIMLRDWLHSFIEEFSLMEHIEPQQLLFELQPDSMSVYFDPNHLQQVMWNLCQNAVKYGANPETGPHITLRAGISDSTREPYLDIIDNGTGIDEQTAEEMFEPFFTTHSEGTGLGLYITRELCECNNARLDYRPNPSGGSCFRISFSQNQNRS